MDNLKPITRTENFLAAAAGDPSEDLTPETREEYFLSRLKGGGGSELEESIVVSNPIGRFAMNETIDKGTSFEEIFRGIMSKTYYPSLTDPSLSFTWSVPSLAKVGSMVASAQAVLNFNRGSINPKYASESEYRSGEATGYSVYLQGASVSYSDSGNSNIFSIPEFTRESKGNVVLNASVNYSEGCQPKDSDGGDYQTPLPAGSKSASKTVEFILPFYWGKKAASSISDFSGLTEDISKKGQKNYRYSGANNEYLYIAYDSSYGNLKNIVDENNIDNIDSWERTSMTVDRQSYTVYRSGFSITGSPSFTFKF